jgi:hypothetical protein
MPAAIFRRHRRARRRLSDGYLVAVSKKAQSGTFLFLEVKFGKAGSEADAGLAA